MTSKIVNSTLSPAYSDPLRDPEVTELEVRTSKKAEGCIAELGAQAQMPVQEMAARVQIPVRREQQPLAKVNKETIAQLPPRSRARKVLTQRARDELRDTIHLETRSGNGRSAIQSHADQEEKMERIKDLYVQLHENLLYEGQDTLIFEFSSGYYSYVDHVTGKTEYVDFLGLDDPDLKEYLNLVESVHPFRNALGIYTAGRKGNAAGPKALQRKGNAFAKLPKTLHNSVKRIIVPKWNTFSPEIQEGMRQRLTFLDQIPKFLIPKLTTLYNEEVLKLKELQDSGEDPVKERQLYNDLILIRQKAGGKDEDDKTHESELNNADFCAVTLALTKDPTQNIRAVLKETREEMHHLLKDSDDPAVKQYLFDTSALLLPKRWEYTTYLYEHGIPIKKEGIEDFYVQEAVHYSEDEIDADRAVKNLFNSKTLSEEMHERVVVLYEEALEEMARAPALDWNFDSKAIEPAKEESFFNRVLSVFQKSDKS